LRLAALDSTDRKFRTLASRRAWPTGPSVSAPASNDRLRRADQGADEGEVWG